MHTLKRCTGADADFRAMVASLDEELNSRYGAQMEFFGPHNHSAAVQQALVIYADGLPVGCGCFKPFSADSVEMKRIFVLSAYRGRRLARALMAELEAWAHEIGYAFAVLETGILQPDAIRLYEAAGYDRIPNYPRYEDVKESFCFRKRL